MDFHTSLPLIWYSDQTSVDGSACTENKSLCNTDWEAGGFSVMYSVFLLQSWCLSKSLYLPLCSCLSCPFGEIDMSRKCHLSVGWVIKALNRNIITNTDCWKSVRAHKKSSIWAGNPKQIFQSVLYIRITEGFKSKSLQNVICEAHKQSGCTQVPSGKRKSKIPYKRFVGMARPRLLLRVSSESVWSRASSRIAQKSPVRNDICNNVSF